MKYIEKIELKETVKEVALIPVKVIRFILNKILSLVRWMLYLISSFGVVVFGCTFPLGLYFGYTVIRDMRNGMAFMQTEYWGFFLLFFCVPLAFAIIKEIV